MLKRVLLGSGIASSVLYFAMDLVGSLRYEGYSYRDQTYSELLADGSPVRSLMVGLSAIPYGALVTAFGAGVWAAARPQRAARITGALLVGYAVVGTLTGVYFRMDTREVLAAGQDDWRSALHPAGTMVQSVCLLLAMSVGARLLNRGFRPYSYTTIVALLIFGVLTTLQTGRMVANESTPWMGLLERVNIYATMVWIAVLAAGLLRAHAPRAERRPAAPAAPARMLPR